MTLEERSCAMRCSLSLMRSSRVSLFHTSSCHLRVYQRRTKFRPQHHNTQETDFPASVSPDPGRTTSLHSVLFPLFAPFRIRLSDLVAPTSKFADELQSTTHQNSSTSPAQCHFPRSISDRLRMSWLHTRYNSHFSDDAVAIFADRRESRRRLPTKRADCRLGDICLAAHSLLAMLLLFSTRGPLGHRIWPQSLRHLDAVANSTLQSQNFASSTDVQVNSNDACAELMSCS